MDLTRYNSQKDFSNRFIDVHFAYSFPFYPMKAFYILDEFIMTGEVQETSTRLILKHVYDQNAMEKSQVSI
jgi:hypothetical protein